MVAYLVPLASAPGARSRCSCARPSRRARRAALGAVAAAAGRARGVLVAVAAWGWGSERLHTLDRSVLAAGIGTAERALVETDEPARARASPCGSGGGRRWGPQRLHERVLLELPLGRAPPQGARLRVLGTLRDPATARPGSACTACTSCCARAPGGASARAARVADRLHAWLARASVPGLAGERRAVLEGVVLGEDGGLSDSLAPRFRASGPLPPARGQRRQRRSSSPAAPRRSRSPRPLAPRRGGCALLAIAAYVLAVGPQPSVLRAGIAGALGCLAWLSGRERDRRYALLARRRRPARVEPVHAARPGFQLSFARRARDLPRSRRGSAHGSRVTRCRAPRGKRSRCRPCAAPRPRRSPGSTSTSPAAHRAGERRRGAGGRADARARAARGRAAAARAGARGGRTAVRGVSRRLCARSSAAFPARRSARRGCRRARGGCPPAAAYACRRGEPS